MLRASPSRLRSAADAADGGAEKAATHLACLTPGERFTKLCLVWAQREIPVDRPFSSGRDAASGKAQGLDQGSKDSAWHHLNGEAIALESPTRSTFKTLMQGVPTRAVQQETFKRGASQSVVR